MVHTLITGGSSGIGKALAYECAARGMNLLLVALPESGLEQVSNDIADIFKVTVRNLFIDLSQPNAPQEVFQWCQQNHYNVNVLINNAGIGGATVFETSDAPYSDIRILVNIRALTLLTQYFIPELKKSIPSYILNVGSFAGFMPIPYKTVYSASKAYVLNFTLALRAELDESGITVCVVCPNGVITNEGTINRIKAHSWKGKLVCIPANEIAKLAITGMFNSKAIIVPGFGNKILFYFSRLIPNKLKLKITKREFMKESTIYHSKNPVHPFLDIL